MLPGVSKTLGPQRHAKCSLASSRSTEMFPRALSRTFSQTLTSYGFSASQAFLSSVSLWEWLEEGHFSVYMTHLEKVSFLYFSSPPFLFSPLLSPLCSVSSSLPFLLLSSLLYLPLCTLHYFFISPLFSYSLSLPLPSPPFLSFPLLKIGPTVQSLAGHGFSGSLH